MPTEQETRTTLESSGDTKTKMIDTTGNSQDAAVTNEFNPGMQNESRIDLSALIPDGKNQPAA